MNSTMTTYQDICISSSYTNTIISIVSVCLAISELAPFTSRIKANGILHSIYLFAKSIKVGGAPPTTPLFK